MKTLIVYYTRTGNTRRCAELLAKETGADVEEIVDNTRRDGIFGYMKSGFQAAMRITVKIEQTKKEPKDYDMVILCTPVWANNITPAIRTYLKGNNLENKKVALLITHGGSGEKKTEREFKKLTEKSEFAGMHAIKMREMKNAEGEIKEFSKALKP